LKSSVSKKQDDQDDQKRQSLEKSTEVSQPTSA
jgi:hypothetical protein